MLKRVVVVAIVCPLPLLLMGADLPWRDYAPPGWSYKISLPSEPVAKPVVERGVPMHAAAVVNPAEGWELVVVAQDLGRHLRTRSDAQECVKSLERGFAQSANTSVKSSTEVTLGKVPGRELIGDNPDGRKIRARVYAVGKISYVVTVKCQNAGDLHGPVASQFIDSFEILNVPAEPFDGGGGSSIVHGLALVVIVLVVAGVAIGAVAGLVWRMTQKTSNHKRRRRPRRYDRDED